MSHPASTPGDYDEVVAQRDEAAAEHRQLRMTAAVERLAATAGADPDRLLDSATFADEFADLGRDPSDADITAAIDRALTAQPVLRSSLTLPVGRPPRAAGGQGSAEITARTTTDRRAAQRADQSPRGQIAAELRRAQDRKNGTHR